MTTLTERIKAIYELDAKRTQGEWRFYEAPAQQYTDTLTSAQHYEEPYYAVECKGDAICDNANYYPKSVGEQDCSFISSAPEMVSIIRELESKLLEYERRLEIDYVVNGDGETEPFPEGAPDAIECRDFTIKMIDESRDRLRAQITGLQGTVESQKQTHDALIKKLNTAIKGLEFYAKGAWTSVASFDGPRVDWTRAPINDDYGKHAQRVLQTISGEGVV